MAGNLLGQDLILASAPHGLVRHWWRSAWGGHWLPVCEGVAWQRSSLHLDRTSEAPICPRCARLVPDAPFLEVTP